MVMALETFQGVSSLPQTNVESQKWRLRDYCPLKRALSVSRGVREVAEPAWLDMSYSLNSLKGVIWGIL